MKVHYGYTDIEFSDPVITMGVFDGVHLGHQMLLRRVVEEARKSGADSVAVTFDPHPRIVLTGDPSHLRFLSDIGERISLLRQTGIDHLVIVPFTPELSRMTAQEFVDEILCRRLGLRHLITGYNHQFGRQQEGASSTITNCSSGRDFRVTREDAFRIEGEAVSSSAIRKALEAGSIRKAAEMLGYNYFVTGEVVSGKKIGRDLGFPTANIRPLFQYKLIPRPGVYAVEALIEGDPARHIGMLNIGLRPTIAASDGRSTIEVHLIGFDADLYGKVVTVSFYERLRDEMKFENLDALIAQLGKDREKTIGLLGS